MMIFVLKNGHSFCNLRYDVPENLFKHWGPAMNGGGGGGGGKVAAL